MAHPQVHHLHHALHLKTLAKDSGATGPRNDSWQVKLTDPALSVMTDFRERAFFKVDLHDPIDDVLGKMRHAGLRAAFVQNSHGDRLLGLITAYDIMGEKPLRFMQSSGATDHKDIHVADVMEPLEQVPIVDIREVERATVQDVLDALEKCGRTHLPVMDHAGGGAPHLRGLFSTSKVLRLTADARMAKTAA